MTTTDYSNTHLAQFGAMFVDYLAGYGHLPALENAMICQRGQVIATLHAPSQADTVRALAVWAKTFHASVTVDSDSGHVSCELEMSGVPVSFREYVTAAWAAELANAMDTPFPQVAATADQVTAGLDVMSAEDGAA